LMSAAQIPTALPLVRVLLASGADLNLQDAYGCTALHYAATPAIHKVLKDYLQSRPSASAASPSDCKPSPTAAKFAVSPKNDSPAKTNNQPALDKIDFLCYRFPSAWRTALNKEVATEFGSKKVLDIRVDDPAKLVSRNASAEITRELLFAVSLWRRVCNKCSVANAAVVQIDGKTYLDKRLLMIIESFDYDKWTLGRESLTYSSPQNPYWLQGMYFNIRASLRAAPLPEYVAVVPSSPSIQRLCSAAPDKIPDEFLGIREAFKCETEPSSSTALLRVRILNGRTQCSSDEASDKKVVGCEVNDSEIELNGRENTYIRHDTSKPIFGNGAYRADMQILILHEMGHSAGIHEHLSSPNNIMSELIEYCRCIDGSVIERLALSTTSSHLSKPRALLHKKPVSAAYETKRTAP